MGYDLVLGERDAGEETMRFLLIREKQAGQDHWAAQLLEHDIAAQGMDWRTALFNLYKSYELALKLAAEKGLEGLSHIPRAPDSFEEMWSEGAPLDPALLDEIDHGDSAEVRMAA